MLISCWNKIPAGNVVLVTSSNPPPPHTHTTPLSAVIRANRLRRSRWINSLWWEICAPDHPEQWCWLFPNISSILNGNSFASTTTEYVFKGAHVGVFSRTPLTAWQKLKWRRGCLFHICWWGNVFISCLLVSKQTPIQPDPTAKAQLGHKLNSVLWIFLCIYFFPPWENYH